MRLLKTIIVLALAPALGGASPPDAAALDWLNENLAPLTTTDPDKQSQDLEEVSAIIGDASVAGFGEATHGSREFFQMKDRAFRYLVARSGFRGFAIEANFAAAEAIDDWIKGGDGDPERLIAGMGFWTWDTEEVLALVKWMRTYNDVHPDKLSFYGVDIQHAAPNLLLALDYLDQYGSPDPARHAAFGAYLTAAVDQRAGYRFMAELPPERASALREQAENLVRALETDRSMLEQKSGKDAYLTALSGASAAVWYFLMEGPREDRRFRNLKSGYDIRDRAMADLAQLALQREGEAGRLFLWAHNAHITNSRFEGDRMTLGQFLKQDIGTRYVSIGFAFDQGQFQAFPPADPSRPDFRPTLSVMSVEPAPDGFHEALLKRARSFLWIVDLRKLGTGNPAAAWLGSERQMRWTGANYSPELMAKHKPISLQRDFDALIFVSRTERARPLKNTRDRMGITNDW